MILRVALAFLAGAAVGWERESRGRPAGLRTTILTCLAAAGAMIISEALFYQSAASGSLNWRPDPARLGAGILTGIGFLGAGTIIRHDNYVRGVTTAATLWVVTVLGLAFGSGQFRIGLLGVTLVLLTLYFLPKCEKLIPSDYYARAKVTTVGVEVDIAALKARLEALGTRVLSFRITDNVARKEKQLDFELRLDRPRLLEVSQLVLAELKRLPGTTEVCWE